ncbi:MAG: hypothetical protein Q7V58_03935 [Actinomycetota bacterium]|nr:hypothetical protein [Actinomycetota bacterium]
MSKVSPFHSRLQDKHHNNNQCTEGNNIEPRNRVSGDGGKPLYDHCRKLS